MADVVQFPLAASRGDDPLRDSGTPSVSPSADPVINRVPMHALPSPAHVAGDVAGIEEASTAMAAGRLAGLSAAYSLGKVAADEYSRKRAAISAELEGLRSGPAGEKIRIGLAKLRNESGKMRNERRA